MIDVIRLAAFADGEAGGNPAGIAFLTAFPTDAEMMATAARVGFSETAFAVKDGANWRVRYFAPEMEVPFCGHATIALGAALGAREGAGVYALKLNNAAITVEAERGAGGQWRSALVSPPTWSKDMDAGLLGELLNLFGLSRDNLAVGFAPAIANAGATHAVLLLKDRATLAAMAYDFSQGQSLMRAHGLVTISLVWRESDGVFHARNAFAAGGVVEDPATGAAAAALGGLLRDREALDLSGGPAGFEIRQGVDMGAPSRIQVQVGPQAGSGVRVAGAVRVLPG